MEKYSTFTHTNPDGTTVEIKMGWFSMILGNVTFGENVVIGNYVSILDNAVIGNNVKLMSGVTIGDGQKVEDNVTVYATHKGVIYKNTGGAICIPDLGILK